MYVGRYVLPWPCPDDILIKSLKKYRHLQLSSFLSSLDLLITIIRYHHDHCQHNKPDSYKARTLETRISTQMIDIQWSSGLHPRNLGRAKDAREVGIDSFRFLQRTQTCTLDLLGRFIYIYIIFANTVSSCSSEQTNFRAGIILLSINWGWALQTHCSAGGLRDCHSLPC